MPQKSKILPVIESEILGCYLSRQVKNLEVGLPYPEITVKQVNLEDIRHVLRRRGDKALFELDPYGMRVQVHYDQAGIRVFNGQFQKVNGDCFGLDGKLEDLLREQGVKDVVLDAKVVVFDEKLERYYPFEEYINDVSREDLDYLRPMMYITDILRLDSETLIEEPILARKAALDRGLGMVKSDAIQIADYEIISSYMDNNSLGFEDQVKELSDFALEKGCRRIIFKNASDEDSSYVKQPRIHKWCSYKSDPISEELQKINVVPVGAFFGKGRNKGKINSFLVAVYDPAKEIYYSVGRINIGLTKETLEQCKLFHNSLVNDDNGNVLELMERKKPDNVIISPTMIPDLWLPLEEVWEVKCNYAFKFPLYTSTSTPTVEQGFFLSGPYFLNRKMTKISSEDELVKNLTKHHELYKL